MHIMDIPITNYNDVVAMESEICRLLRCSNSKCAAMHTESFMRLRANLLSTDTNSVPMLGRTVYMPEGLVLTLFYGEACRFVELSWMYAEVTHTLL